MAVCWLVLGGGATESDSEMQCERVVGIWPWTSLPSERRPGRIKAHKQERPSGMGIISSSPKPRTETTPGSYRSAERWSLPVRVILGQSSGHDLKATENGIISRH